MNLIPNLLDPSVIGSDIVCALGGLAWFFLNLKQLWSVSKAYSLVMREERHRNVVRGQEEGGDITDAFAVQVTTKTKVFSQSGT